MFYIYLIGCISTQVWAWRTQSKRLQGRTVTRLQSVSRYAGWAFLPVLLFAGGFAAMVGIEEWLHVALIDERAALLAFPVFGLAVVGTVAFAVRCAVLRDR